MLTSLFHDSQTFVIDQNIIASQRTRLISTRQHGCFVDFLNVTAFKANSWLKLSCQENGLSLSHIQTHSDDTAAGNFRKQRYQISPFATSFSTVFINFTLLYGDFHIFSYRYVFKSLKTLCKIWYELWKIDKIASFVLQ